MRHSNLKRVASTSSGKGLTSGAAGRVPQVAETFLLCRKVFMGGQDPAGVFPSGEVHSLASSVL